VAVVSYQTIQVLRPDKVRTWSGQGQDKVRDKVQSTPAMIQAQAGRAKNGGPH
jgi:hypothetical protein